MAIRLAPTAAFAALSLAVTALAGCGSEEKKGTPESMPTPAAAPAPPAAQMPAAPQAAPAPQAAAMPAPQAAAPTGDYPADFPSDVPRYPGSKVTSVRGSGEMGFSVTIDAPDTAQAVAKYFGDKLTASGWETVVQELPEGLMVIATKNEGRAQAFVHEGGQGTLVELIVGEPQPE